MAFYDGHYLLSGDGTGYYSSSKVASPYCLVKKFKNGEAFYYQQIYAASFVCPGCKVVIPTFPEVITQQDGSTKNDCERNAAKRYYAEFRREHPHLKVIVVEDGLSSNGPHIRDLKVHNLRFILGAKPGDHVALFTQLNQAVAEGKATDLEFLDPDDRKKMHFFRFATGCVDIISENGVTVYNFYNLSIITYLRRVQPARGGRRGGLKAFRRFKSARNWRNRKGAVKNI